MLVPHIRVASSLATRRVFVRTMATSPNGPTKKSLDYLLILDFEATCGDAVKQMEIIEFPTLLYNIKEGWFGAFTSIFCDKLIAFLYTF